MQRWSEVEGGVGSGVGVEERLKRAHTTILFN